MLSNTAMVFSSTGTLPTYNDVPTIEMLSLLSTSRIFSNWLFLLASLSWVKVQ